MSEQQSSDQLVKKLRSLAAIPVFGADHIETAADEIERLRDALNAIASWGEGTEVTSSFDEPTSARMARTVLGKDEVQK